MLFGAGDQVPVTPFIEVVGKGDKVAPLHIGAIFENTGVTFNGLTVTVIEAPLEQTPEVGVNV